MHCHSRCNATLPSYAPIVTLIELRTAIPRRYHLGKSITNIGESALTRTYDGISIAVHATGRCARTTRADVLMPNCGERKNVTNQNKKK